MQMSAEYSMLARDVIRLNIVPQIKIPSVHL